MKKIAVPNLLSGNRAKIIAVVAIAAMLSLTYMSPLSMKHQTAAILNAPPGLSGCDTTPIVVKEPLQVNVEGFTIQVSNLQPIPEFKTVIAEKEIFQCTRTVADLASGTAISFPVIREITIIPEIFETIGPVLNPPGFIEHIAPTTVEVITCEKQLDQVVNSVGTTVSTPLHVDCTTSVPTNSLTLKTCIPLQLTTPDAPVQMASGSAEAKLFSVTAPVVKNVIVEKEILSCDTGANAAPPNPTPTLNTFDSFVIESIFEQLAGNTPAAKSFETVTCQKDPATSTIIGCSVSGFSPIRQG